MSVVRYSRPQQQSRQYVKRLNRRAQPQYVRGSGAYKLQRSQYLRPYAKAGGSALGGFIGGKFGGPAGAVIGKTAGSKLGALSADLIRTVTGHGDYHVKENTLVPGSMPLFKNESLPGGAIRVCHTEYMTDILSQTTAGDLGAYTWYINPGYTDFLPYLSQLAVNFQEYKINGMIFQYRATCSDAIATGTSIALGTGIMAMDYNATSAPLTTKAEFLDLQGSRSFKISESCYFPVECARGTSPLQNLYINVGSSKSRNDNDDQDARFTDFGQFSMATDGIPFTSQNCGELYCSYDITLYKPKLVTAVGNQQMFAYIEATTGISATVPLGTNAYNLGVNTMPVTISSSTDQLILPASSISQTFTILVYWIGASTASLVAPILTFTNCASSSSIYYQSPPDTATSATMTLVYLFQTLGNSKAPTINFGVAGTLPASLTYVNVVITQIPNSVYEAIN